MKVNTALSFILSGFSLILLSALKPACVIQLGRTRLVYFMSVLVASLALATLCQYLFGFKLGIDQLLVPDASIPSAHAAPGRMSPGTAFNFFLVGPSSTE